MCYGGVKFIITFALRQGNIRSALPLSNDSLYWTQQQFSFHGSKVKEKWWQNIQWQEQERCRIWLINQFCTSWRAEPSEQSCDGHLGMWCHHSISKSDDEPGVFLSASSVDYQTGSPCLFCDARSIPKQHVHFAITPLSFKSICHMKGLDLISALAPWQPSASWEVHCCNDKVFHVTLPICISDVALSGSTHNDLCLSPALLLLHRESDGKSQSRRREQNQ